MHGYSLGLTLTILGMGTVFLVLALLAGILSVLNRGFTNQATEGGPLNPPIAASAEDREVGSQGQDQAVIAAVMAAIATLEEGRQYKILSLSTVGQPRVARPWVRAGREELMETSQPFLG